MSYEARTSILLVLFYEKKEEKRRKRMENVKKIIEKSGVSVSAFAESTGVSPNTLKNYLAGNQHLTLDAVCKIADFTGLSTDVILDRCGLDGNFEKDFQRHRKEAMEEYIRMGRKAPAVEDTDTILPWPYGLYKHIFGEIPEIVLTEEHEKALNTAIDHLTERQRWAVLGVYQQGKLLKNLADESGLSYKDVRRTLARGLHALRLRKTLLNLEYLRYADIDTKYKKLSAERQKLLDENAKLRQMVIEQKKLGLDEIRIDEVCFSTRTYNVLDRRGIENMQEVAEAAKNGLLITFRNMGKNSIAEVLEKLKEFGLDYSHLYNNL